MRHPLLEQLVDYAGLFPPASLQLDDAVGEYVAHRQDDEAWMLGRFICPESRLESLAAFTDHFSITAPLRVSLLPAAGDEPAERLRRAAAAADAFERRMAGHARVELFELRMPEALPEAQLLSGAGPPARDRFAYLEWSPDRSDLVDCLETLAAARTAGSTNLGAKIRCGGTEPEAYPSVEVVSGFLSACARLELPFKATAGLHHPVRHDRDDGTMHGFLNVFGGFVLARVHRLDAEETSRIIEDKDPDSFSLDAGGFRWKDLSATTEEVSAARRLARGFGSCSFSEPVEDLHEAGWFSGRS